MANLTTVIKVLEQERSHLSVQMEGISPTLSLPKGKSSGRARRKISTAGRACIAAAQRARWAKTRTKKIEGASNGARKDRTISPAARKRIAAAQKARWAKWRRAHNTQ